MFFFQLVQGRLQFDILHHCTNCWGRGVDSGGERGSYCPNMNTGARVSFHPTPKFQQTMAKNTQMHNFACSAIPRTLTLERAHSPSSHLSWGPPSFALRPSLSPKTWIDASVLRCNSDFSPGGERRRFLSSFFSCCRCLDLRYHHRRHLPPWRPSSTTPPVTSTRDVVDRQWRHILRHPGLDVCEWRHRRGAWSVLRCLQLL